MSAVRIRFVVPVAVLPFLAAASTAALDSPLGAEGVSAALAHGRALYGQLRAAGQPVDEVEPGYLVDRGRDVGHAVLTTEFSAVALEARRWLAIGRDYAAADVEQTLHPLRGRVRFTVVLQGDQRDFLRGYAVRLVQGEAEHSPIAWDVFRGTRAATAGRWIASGQYDFGTKDLDREAPATLRLRRATGQDVRFEFALHRLR
jgi:hypothetical protein